MQINKTLAHGMATNMREPAQAKLSSQGNADLFTPASHILYDNVIIAPSSPRRAESGISQQIGFSGIEFDAKKKTRRDLFLAKMETIVLFARLVTLIAPHYPTSGRRGRPPLDIERMRRMVFVQQWYGLP